ncbi:MAG: SDR family oxidoreductase [Oscillospiraceae bacterium]|jgi:NAD(P)-dependent dehydrogenase (short-subunit alcohol dehydrogenase family)|nr:SDR family oxidoreductase [Oscillospiraceae bacterium]
MPTKTALIIGGSRGIGAATALQLARDGYDIALTYSTAVEAAQEVKTQVEAIGKRCFYYQGTMDDAESPIAVTQQAIADLGRLDALVTVAGITKIDPLLRWTAARLDEIWAVDFRAPILCTIEAAKQMKLQWDSGEKRGVMEPRPYGIVHIASIHGHRAVANDAIYGALKAAIIRSTQSEALEFGAYGIRVNAISPGLTATRKHHETSGWLTEDWAGEMPLGRVGLSTEMADVIAWLLSEKSNFVTGQTIPVDGGQGLLAHKDL